MTMDEFVNNVNGKWLIDDDGHGHYATSARYDPHRVVKPSDLAAGKLDRSYTHIVWYNR